MTPQRTPEPAAPPQVPIDKGAVLDESEFFRLSYEIEGLRDAIATLLAHRPTSSRALALVAEQYEQIRTQAAATLRDDVAGSAGCWVKPVQPGADVDELFVAAAGLCRWLDATLQLPALIASYRHALREISGIEGALAAAPQTPDADEHPADQPVGGPYL